MRPFFVRPSGWCRVAVVVGMSFCFDILMFMGRNVFFSLFYLKCSPSFLKGKELGEKYRFFQEKTTRCDACEDAWSQKWPTFYS